MGKNKNKSKNKSEFSIKNEIESAQRLVDEGKKRHKLPEELVREIEELKKSRETGKGSK